MIGNNSCGVHSIMAGKTDDNIDALEILTYDGQRLHVGATSADDFDRFIREGGRRAEIYTASSLSPTATASRSNANSRIFRAASPDTTSTTCFPRAAFTCAVAGRFRRHLRHHSRSHVPAGRKSASACAARHRMA